MAALSEDAIFDVARQISSQAARDAYLDQICNGNGELRARVEELLAAHEAADSRLDGSPLEPTATHADPLPLEKPGTQIGPYKLLQQLGEGGMGVVYMAEQKHPVKRRVALKIIKPGMDSQQVLARFEAERQTLAMMDHPNIARVLDAGMTDSGRPYFVMDLVKGIPMNEYCDEHNLSTRERLELFIHVCRALQHAHHKGIVHRDVKPSNVLVAEFDNQAVPKVIDFGVAKAVDQQLTERTMFTHFGQVVGTPEYMSPEQAKLNQLDVDTRSDIYSLGVLLYELLTGTTPFDKQRLRSVAFDELLRIVREEEPLRPSLRLSTVDELPTIATNRKSDPRRLSLLLRGELDWMVMKALDKERSRRYDSANAFADDVQRYLGGDRVLACPPSRKYLFRKFAARHKTTIATTALMLGTLFCGLGGTSWMAFEAIRAQQKAESALALLRDKMIEDAFVTVMSGDLENIDEAIASAAAVAASEDTLNTLRGLAALYRGQLNESLAALQQATCEGPQNLTAWLALRLAYSISGRGDMLPYSRYQMEQRGLSPDGNLRDYELLMAVQVENREDAIDDLIKRRPAWTIARGARAYMLADREATQQQLEQALRDVTLLREVLPSSPVTSMIDLRVHAAIVECGDARGWDVSESREKARLAAQDLDRFPNFLLGRICRMHYYQQIGDDELAKREIHALVEREWGGRWVKAVQMYRKYDIDGAEALLKQESSPWAGIAMAFVQAEKDRATALQTYRSFIQREDIALRHRVQAMDVLRLVGEDQATIRVEIQKIDWTESDGEGFFWRHTRQFLLGDLNERQFLDPLSSDAIPPLAYYMMGLKHLSEGERKSAKECFEKACQDFSPGVPYCHWSQAFLERLRDDPNWPARIQHNHATR